MGTRRRDEGAAALEYVGVIVAVAAVVAVVVSSFSASRTFVVQAVDCAVGQLVGEAVACPQVALPGLSPGEEAQRLELLERAEGLRTFAASGQAAQDLLDEAEQALTDGHLARAQEALDRLALYQDLASSEPRGEYLHHLLAASDEEHAAAMDRGNIYLDGGAYNTRYFQLEDPPGGGVVVMDYFIDSAGSGLVLAGDDRDHADPLRGDLSLHDSRMMLVVDLETGRGQVYVTETCTTGIRVCNEPRPNVFDGSVFSNDTGTRPVVPLLDNDYDIANQFTFSPADGGFELHYDALNGIIPVGSVDGTVSVHVGADGQMYIGEDDRDNYPSIGTYYYSEPGRTQVVQQREQEGVVCGALPVNVC